MEAPDVSSVHTADNNCNNKCDDNCCDKAEGRTDATYQLCIYWGISYPEWIDDFIKQCCEENYSQLFEDSNITIDKVPIVLTYTSEFDTKYCNIIADEMTIQSDPSETPNTQLLFDPNDCLQMEKKYKKHMYAVTDIYETIIHHMNNAGIDTSSVRIGWSVNLCEWKVCEDSSDSGEDSSEGSSDDSSDDSGEDSA